MTERDVVAVERLASGLIKLLYPDGRVTSEELHQVAALAWRAAAARPQSALRSRPGS